MPKITNDQSPSIARAMMALARVMRKPNSLERDFVIAQLLGFMANESGTHDLAAFLLTAHTMQRFEDDGIDHSLLIPDIDKFVEELMVMGAEAVREMQAESEKKAPYEELKAQQVALLDTFKRLKQDLVRTGELEGELDPTVEEDMRDIPSFSGFDIKSTLSEESS